VDGRGIGVRFHAGITDFLLSTASIPALGPIQALVEYDPGAVSPRKKRPGCEANNSPPTSAKVKNCGAIPPLPIRLWCGA
jgi:hypothetical protein